MAKLSAAVVTGSASKGGVIVDWIYLLDIVVILSLVITGGASILKQTVRIIGTNYFIPRYPSNQAITRFNAATGSTFLDLVLRGLLPLTNVSEATMITHYYEKRITLSVLISLSYDVFVASYLPRNNHRNICALIGAWCIAEEALGRFKSLSGLVRLKFACIMEITVCHS